MAQTLFFIENEIIPPETCLEDVKQLEVIESKNTLGFTPNWTFDGTKIYSESENWKGAENVIVDGTLKQLFQQLQITLENYEDDIPLRIEQYKETINFQAAVERPACVLNWIEENGPFSDEYYLHVYDLAKSDEFIFDGNVEDNWSGDGDDIAFDNIQVNKPFRIQFQNCDDEVYYWWWNLSEFGEKEYIWLGYNDNLNPRREIYYFYNLNEFGFVLEDWDYDETHFIYFEARKHFKWTPTEELDIEEFGEGEIDIYVVFVSHEEVIEYFDDPSDFYPAQKELF